MLKTIAIEDIQHRLPEIISALGPGEAVVIEAAGAPIARLTREERTDWPCQPGSSKQLAHWMAPDFDAPLDDFKEYMK